MSHKTYDILLEKTYDILLEKTYYVLSKNVYSECLLAKPSFTTSGLTLWAGLASRKKGKNSDQAPTIQQQPLMYHENYKQKAKKEDSNCFLRNGN